MNSICTGAPYNIKSECVTRNLKKTKKFVKGISRKIFRRMGLGDGPTDHFERGP